MSNDNYNIIACTLTDTGGATGTGNSTISISAASSNVCTSTRWLTEEVFQLIDFVQRNEAIYNSRHKYYFCRPYVENFWRDVDRKLEKSPGASLAKWTNLRISFRREYTNYLEEKVPPCWTYFDRMFFLHPYLRKKYQPHRSLNSCVREALAQISSIQTCKLARERLESNSYHNCTTDSTAPHESSKTSSSAPPGQFDNYLEYLDETEPEPNACELDDVVDAANIHPIVKDIKSECEDNVDEYEQENPSIVDDDCNDDCYSELNDLSTHNGQHIQYSYRLQSKTEHFENVTKRIRLEDDVSSTSTFQQPLISSSIASGYRSNNGIAVGKPSRIHKHYRINVSPVANGIKSISQNSINSNTRSNNIIESTSHPMNTNSTEQSNHYLLGTNQNSYQDVDFPAEMAQSIMNMASNASTSTPAARASLVATSDLCDCKSDPDAMFLMSLLPDIQKLNGRDRGKIKIAFQNILQDFLYPD